MRIKSCLGGFCAVGSVLAVVIGFLTLPTAAEIVLEKPASGTVVSTRSPQMDRSLSADVAEALEIFQDKSRRTAPAAVNDDFPTTFTVACVNCGSFHYGDKETPKATYRDNWKKMVRDADADIFFFEDFGKKFSTGRNPGKKLDICHLAKMPPDEVAILPLTREINGKKTPRYRALRLCRLVNGKRIAFYGVHLVAEGHIPGKKRNADGLTPSQQLRRLQFAELIEDAKKI